MPFASAHESTYSVPSARRPWQVLIPGFVAQTTSWPVVRQVPVSQLRVIPVAQSLIESPSQIEVTPDVAHERGQWGTGVASQLAQAWTSWNTLLASQM